MKKVCRESPKVTVSSEGILFTFGRTFSAGSSCSADGGAARSVQLSPLSCDLECVTHRIRDSFLSPAFHFNKSFHAHGLIRSTFLFVGSEVIYGNSRNNVCRKKDASCWHALPFQELTFSSDLTNTGCIEFLVLMWNETQRRKRMVVFASLEG